MDVNGNKKGFCKHTGGKRKARGNVVPQPNDWAFSDAAQPDNTGHGKAYGAECLLCLNLYEQDQSLGILGP